ncbi:MAG: roadblock/LC7 domain-containing protein [Candidatus Odinarchaeia archaeon]
MAEDKEIKIKREKIMQLLKELEEKTDLEATAVVTKEGMRLACSVSAEMDADIFSAAAAAMVNLGSMTIRRLRQGNLKEIIIKGNEGYTIVTEADETTMIVAAGRQSFRLGYYLGVLKKYASDIAKILKTIKEPVESIIQEEIVAPATTKTTTSVEQTTNEEESTPKPVTTTVAEKTEEKAIAPVKPKTQEITEEEKTALEAERKAILEALKALGWEESASE